MRRQAPIRHKPQAVSGSAAGKESEVYQGTGDDGSSAWRGPDEMDVDQGTGDDRGSAYLVSRATRIPHMTRSDELFV